MRSTKSFWGRFDRLLVFCMILGIGMSYWGISLNGMVIAANNGSMPITSEPDVLVNTDGVARHYAKEGSAELLILADRTRIYFEEIKTREGWLWGRFNEWARWVKYPIEGGLNMVSIGDILHWAGSALYLLIIPLLCLRIPFRLTRDGIRYGGKKSDHSRETRT